MPTAPPVTIAVRPESLAIALAPAGVPRNVRAVLRPAPDRPGRQENEKRHAMKKGLEDKLAIRELIDHWAVWRDSFRWDRFRTVWHPEGRMWATWFQGTYEEFIEANLQGYKKGVRIYHFLGGSSIDIKGTRAIAQTKMSISQRALVEGVE